MRPIGHYCVIYYHLYNNTLLALFLSHIFDLKSKHWAENEIDKDGAFRPLDIHMTTNLK
jgi:hypothetical protein